MLILKSADDMHLFNLTWAHSGLFAAGLLCLNVGCTTTPVYLNSGKVLPSTLPFSEAVQVGGTLYLSGQIGNLPGGLKLAAGGIKAEAAQVLQNIKTTLDAHGYGMGDIVKCTAMLADMSEWSAFNEVYEKSFASNRYPARSAFGVTSLAFNARVELECVAAKPSRWTGAWLIQPDPLGPISFGEKS